MPALGMGAASVLVFPLPSMHAAQGRARGGKGRTWAAGPGSLAEHLLLTFPSPSTVGNAVYIWSYYMVRDSIP